MAPVVEGSSPFTHPKAPVAQLDRASDFESAGRPFEPDRARHAPRGVHGWPEPHVVQGATSNMHLESVAAVHLAWYTAPSVVHVRFRAALLTSAPHPFPLPHWGEGVSAAVG